MFLELIATFVAGVAAGGIVLGLVKLTGNRLPRALIPIGAGLAMIGFAIWSEYNWFPRNVANLPEGHVVVRTNESRSVLRPWTFVAPFVDRFVSVQPSAALTHPDRPDERLVEVFVFGRWAPLARVPVLLDCAESRRADLIDGTEFAADGTIEGAEWIALDDTDPLLRAVCDADAG